MPDLILISQAADLLGVSRWRIHQLMKAGELRAAVVENTSGRGRVWLDRKEVAKLKERRDGRSQ